MEKKIDITSTALEKGIDLAKEFVDKLIGPAIEETGLLLKDRVILWRLKNQVQILNKAKEYCIKYKISTKTISLKLLCPFLDYAALEEEEILQDKWAILLSNMVDSNQNIENHVFPYLLSQISVNEFMVLENVLESRNKRNETLNYELENFKKNKPNLEKEIKYKIEEIKKRIEKPLEQKNPLERWELQKEKMRLDDDLRNLNYKEKQIIHSIACPEYINQSKLQEYEISNLIRLGVIKSIPRPFGYVTSHRIRNEPDSDYLKLEDLEVKIETEEEDLILTELGEMFIKACNSKNKLSQTR